jgi:hypothetical protein
LGFFVIRYLDSTETVVKPIAFSLVVAIALTMGGYLWIETAKQNAIRLQELETQRRDEWIADTIDRLKKGEPSVYLYSCANTDLLLEKIEGMPEVQRIVFERTIDLSAKGIRYLSSFPNLRHLDFRGEKALNDETITILVHCKTLETLGIKLCDVTDAGIPAIAKISTLKEFRHSRDIGQTALSALIESSPGMIIRESEWYNQ